MRRREAIAEVLSTEISYRQRLTVLHEVFYQRCTSNGLLTRDERDEIFLNVEELLLRSGLLIADLQDKNGAGSGEHLCAVFLRHSKHLENCFERYCVQHSEAGSLLSHLCTENSKFITFLSKSSQNPKCDNLDLSSFLLEPVQRLARYPLLLRQVGSVLHS